MATLKTAADYAAALAAAQNTWKSSAGNAAAQKAASSTADQLRKAAASSGVNLSGYGTANGYGTDYTKPQGSGMNNNGTPNTSGLKDLGYGFSSKGDINTAPWHPDTYSDSVRIIGKSATDWNAERTRILNQAFNTSDWTAYNAFNAKDGGMSPNSLPSGYGSSITAVPAANRAEPSYPAFTQPTSPELSWDQALGQARSQLDPMLARALAGVDTNRYQDQLNTGEIAANYGGNHSGLAADAQGKVLIAASGKKADLQANRDATAAQMADALVARSQDRADRLRQQAFSEWTGQQDLGLRRDQFGWGQQMDTAGLTGNWDGGRTLDGLSADRAFDQQQWDNRFNYGQATGTFNNGQRSLDYTQLMAALTGRLPNGQKTSAQQQMELENLWKAADSTGIIPDSLATMYGMPKGTQTQAAKQFAMGNSLDWFNANTSRSSSNSSSSNAAFGRLTDIWAATGKAPAGLESYGVKPGDPYKPEVAAQLKPPTAESMRTYFDGMVNRDKNGKITNGADLEASILNSPVSDYDAYQLYLRYGLSWNGPVPSPN